MAAGCPIVMIQNGVKVCFEAEKMVCVALKLTFV